jgi:hypothetical protein
MRAAEIDSTNTVINFVDVPAFGGNFLPPLNAVIGSVWNGTTFINPTAPPVPQASYAPIIEASYCSALQRQANKLALEGKTYLAVQLLLKSQGITS